MSGTISRIRPGLKAELQPALDLGLQPRTAYAVKASIIEDAGARELDPGEFLARLYGHSPVERLVCVFSSLDTYRTYGDHDDLLEAAAFRSDAYVPPCTFFRGHYSGKTVRQLLALVIDLDNLDPGAVRYVMQRITEGHLLRPTMLVNSGGGIHLYYLLAEPIEVYRRRYDTLLTLKRALTLHVQGVGRGKIDMLSLVQPHRLPGSQTKNGDRVGAYETGDAYDFRALVEALNLKIPKDWGTDGGPRSTTSEKKPAQPAQTAQVLPFTARKPQFYRAVLARLFADRHAAAGRERALFAVAIVGFKCGMTRREVERDTLQLAELLNSYRHEHNLSELDIRREQKKWMAGYSVKYIRTRGCVLADYFGWEWGAKAVKRNGRAQDEHLAAVAASKTAVNALKVRKYRVAHPDASQVKCASDTGLSRKTVIKYWGGP